MKAAEKCGLVATVVQRDSSLGQTELLEILDQLASSMTRPGLKVLIIDGKKIAEAVKAEIAEEVARLVARGRRPPHLTAVIVGDDKASRIYVGNKMKAAEKCGLKATVVQRDSSLGQTELLEILEILDQLGSEAEVDGILVQLPLPSHIHEKTICNALPPHKDVDAFHIDSIGHVCSGEPRLVLATPLGVLEILQTLRVCQQIQEYWCWSLVVECFRGRTGCDCTDLVCGTNLHSEDMDDILRGHAMSLPSVVNQASFGLVQPVTVQVWSRFHTGHSPT